MNVAGSFLVADKEAIRGANILLVDDVLTTAATASEAASALKNNGAGVVFVLTVAS
jgi:predicted amidophosphoribosyltransferase